MINYNGFPISFEIIYRTARVIGHVLIGEQTAKTMSLLFHKEMFEQDFLQKHGNRTETMSPACMY